ncbi:MAG: hypothetical protein FWD53_12820, partial [Phycisphaerales bacterium]|nr:hypothetical protein [Phycisphaerales bacterium]
MPTRGTAKTGDGLPAGSVDERKISAQMGFLTQSLEHIMLEGLKDVPVFLRTVQQRHDKPDYQFIMYSSPESRFTERHRKRLLDGGVKFIYVPMEHKSRFRQQVEKHLDATVKDKAWPIAAKAELLYETGVELAEELLAEKDFDLKIPRMEAVVKAVTTLVLQDSSAFSHLFAVSQHDCGAATHMINVGMWMVPLAYACGISDANQLSQIGLAGIVHDIGKIFVADEVLNKTGPLTEADWRQLRSHPIMGRDHLKGA